jgi:hypothetical protein
VPAGAIAELLLLRRGIISQAGSEAEATWRGRADEKQRALQWRVIRGLHRCRDKPARAMERGGLVLPKTRQRKRRGCGAGRASRTKQTLVWRVWHPNQQAFT